MNRFRGVRDTESLTAGGLCPCISPEGRGREAGGERQGGWGQRGWEAVGREAERLGLSWCLVGTWFPAIWISLDTLRE